MKKSAKKAINISIIVIQLAVIVACIVFSVFTLMANNTQDEETRQLKNGIHLMPVMSDSMNGDKKDSFKQGDVILTKTYKDKSKYENLKVGDIITYYGYLSGTGTYGYVTHRIVDLAYFEHDPETLIGYVVQGDNPLATEREVKRFADIQAVYVGKLAGLGNAIAWLSTPINFFLVIIVPLLLLLIYNIVLVIRAMESKKLALAKAKQEEDLARLQLEQEERLELIKQQMLEELKKQKDTTENQSEDKSDNSADIKTDDTAVNIDENSKGDKKDS